LFISLYSKLLLENKIQDPLVQQQKDFDKDGFYY